MKHTDKFLLNLFENWEKQDMLTFLSCESESNLFDICREVLLGQFSDCNTVDDLKKVVANIEYLTKPSLYKIEPVEQYEGWSNRETCAMANFMHNDHSVNNEYVRRGFEAAKTYALMVVMDNVAIAVSIGSLSRVNWFEIAEEFLVRIGN